MPDQSSGSSCPQDSDPRPTWARHWATLLLLLGCASAVVADANGDFSSFEHSRWTSRDGFPGQVSSMAQTADGYLWLATGQSLYRFDGLVLERYRAADGSYLPAVSALAAHPDGSLWIGLRHGGLVRVHNGGTTRLGPEQGVPEGIPYDLKVDARGMLLAAIEGQAFSGDQRGWQPVDLPGISGNPRIRTVFVDRDGGTWLGGARLWHRSPSEDRFSLSDPDFRNVGAISEAPNGQLWVAESEPARLRPLAPAPPGGPPSGGFPMASSSITFDHDGGLWVGTPGDGIHYMPTPDLPGDPASARFTAPQGLSGEFVGPALTDREGNLWFGTDAGLDRFRQSDLIRVGFPSGAHNFALAVAADGTVWAGSMNRHAVRLREHRPVSTPVPPPVHIAQPGLHGGVWLAGPHGIWKGYGDRVERVLDLPPDVGAAAQLLALAEDREGNLWVASFQHGLYRWRDESWHREPAHGHLPTQTAPVRAVVDHHGFPWFGYRDNLLVNIREGRTHLWGPEDGLNVGHVTAILFTSTDQWLGGSLGLSRFDGTRFFPVQFADGYAVSGLHGLVKTTTGEIWLHGNQGVLRIEAGEIEQFRDDPTHLVRPRRLGPLEQLADDTFQLRPLPTAVAGNDGHIWLATSNGVRRVDPRTVLRGEAPPTAHILSIRSDDREEVDPTDPVLPAMTRRVEITYTAIGLKYPESLRFRHRLVGFEQTWHESGAARQATYVGLSPGEYVFEVAAAYGDGTWSDPAVTAFALQPALHQTKLFIVLCVAAAVVMLGLAYRLRVRWLANALSNRLEVQHRERERIARELHDTLLQSVQGLTLRFQAAFNQLPPDEPARQKLEAALEQADRVMIEGRDRVSGLRAHEPLAGELLPALTREGHQLAEEHEVRFRVIAHGKAGHIAGHIQDEIFRIAREALINAFRHARANAIELEFTCDHDGLRLRVRDDGAGIPKAVLEQRGREGHWGLAGMKERAERIGATFVLWSREGAGTEVDIHLHLPSGEQVNR